MRRFRIGVQLQPQHVDWPTYVAGVRQFDELGVDTIWNWDHFFPLTGDPAGNHFEGWTLLAAMAGLTTRAEVGCLVTCTTYRNPALLSNMAKTVDHISGGRLILGLGAGWFERDYAEYGYPFGTAAERLRALGEAPPLIRARWEQDTPRPTRQIPILIGGSGEKVTLRLTAQHADMWNDFGPPESFARKNQVLNDWCAEVGRDPAAIERTVWLPAEEAAQGDALFDAYAAAGATHLILGTEAPFDVAGVQALRAWRDRRNA
jgi:probable F420-dependent oxidoreductase